MELELTGQRVTEEIANYVLSLRTDANYEIQIETDFSVRTSQGESTFSVEKIRLGLSVFDSLIGHMVTSSSATDTGKLELAFDNGTSLSVESDATYEAWSIAGPKGRKVVCMPGGELAVWKAMDN